MIDRQIVDGRPATVAYLTDAFEPADPDTARYVKVIFDDDGDMVLLASPDVAAENDGQAEADAWNRYREHQRPPAPPKGPLLHGKSLAKWAAVFIQGDINRIDNVIRTGLTRGLTNTDIARAVVGSISLHGIDGATEITRRHLAYLGRVMVPKRKKP